MAELNDKQFFHGTAYDLDGGVVRSADAMGRGVGFGNHGHSGQRSREHAFATTNEHTAWYFADVAEMRGEGKADRARVHMVTPVGEARPGVYHSEHPAFSGSHGEDLQEYVAKGWKSHGTIDIQPGRQGTFPSLNWNQFRVAGANDDTNHPSDDAIANGTSVRNRYKKQAARWEQETYRPALVHPDQGDLFSNRTAGQSAIHDDSELGEYMRNHVYGSEIPGL